MKFLQILFLFIFSSSVSVQAQSYWQQKINYNINVHLDVKTNILTGKQVITYYNNSPDTLKELYFHLYWNAFKKNSYMQRKSLAVNRSQGDMINSLAKDEEGDVSVKQIKVNKRLLKWDEHDTVLRLQLEEALNPNSSIIIEVDFVSQVPLLTRRAGRDNSQGIRFSMAQWYPKLAEYDSEGWHHDEYAGREFYGIWGDFDVSITLDSKYVVASSGEIQNPEIVKCGYDLGKTDTTILEPASGIQKDSVKTWRFRAENVHDFAWAADDKFIHDITYWKEVTIHSLYIPSYRERWKNVKKYAEVMLDFYSETYGKYPYKTFTVVQAGDGGMEYPTIIFNAGFSPGLMAHEGGHQWFYGLLGNNESREGWLDEGIITYTTDKNCIERFNYPVKIEPEEGLGGILQLPYDVHNNYRSYWGISKFDLEEPILTHSDHFKDDAAYSFATYVKGSFIMPMLEYVIGDDVFNRFMKRYFDEWHFKHPHSSDFQRVAEKESGMELDWFFDEWLRTTKTCDYAINSLSGYWIDLNGKRKYRVTCELENRDDIIMPIDLQINFKEGTSKKCIIPIDWNPKQETEAIMLPRWKWVDKSYSFSYDFDEEVTSVIIDPTLRLKDLNRLNNSSGFLPPFDFNFVRPIQFAPPIDKYWITYRPSVWYSVPDGFRFGLVERGGYMGSPMVNPDYRNNAGLWYAAKSKQFDFELSFSFPLSAFGKMASVTINTSKLYGIKNIGVIANKIFTPLSPYSDVLQSVDIYYNFYRLDENDYPFQSSKWDRGSTNRLGIQYKYENESNSRITLTGETVFDSRVNYSKLTFEYLRSLSFLPVSFRFYSGFASALPAVQDRFYLSSANPLEEYSNSFYRSLLFLSNKSVEKIGLNKTGGAGLTSKIDDNISGRNILSLNIETNPVSLEDIGIRTPVISGISFIAFSNFANVWTHDFESFDNFIDAWYAEAGLAITWSPFGRRNLLAGIFQELNDLNIRFNFPLLLNRVPEKDKYFDWRWNISIGKVIDL